MGYQRVSTPFKRSSAARRDGWRSVWASAASGGRHRSFCVWFAWLHARADPATLLSARAVQGVGASILLPNSLALLGKTLSGSAEGRAIGVWAGAGAAAGAIRPILGGWLIDLSSWRAIFVINLPLAAGVILLVLRYVAPDKNAERPLLDTLGGFLATIGVGALTWALTMGSGKSGWTPMTAATGLAALAVMLLFTLVEKRRGDRAMMPLHLFASRPFVGLTLFTLLLYAALGGLFVLLPYLLIKVGGYSSVAAGAALLPLPLILSVTSPVIGDLAGRVGPRLPLAIGSSVAAGGASAPRSLRSQRRCSVRSTCVIPDQHRV